MSENKDIEFASHPDFDHIRHPNYIGEKIDPSINFVNLILRRAIPFMDWILTSDMITYYVEASTPIEFNKNLRKQLNDFEGVIRIGISEQTSYNFMSKMPLEKQTVMEQLIPYNIEFYLLIGVK